MNETKSPLKSKINIASALTSFVGALTIVGVIPVELETKLLQLIVVMQPMVVIVLRTYFTHKNLSWDAKTS